MTVEEIEKLINRTTERMEFAEATKRFSDFGYLEAVLGALLEMQTLILLKDEYEWGPNGIYGNDEKHAKLSDLTITEIVDKGELGE